MSTKKTKPRAKKPKTWAITIEDHEGTARRYVISDVSETVTTQRVAWSVEALLGGTVTSTETAGVQDEKLRRYVTGLEKAGDEMTLWFPFSSTHRATRVAEWTAARNSKP